MSDFLNSLKKAVETGEFNSDPAKKINQIVELAATKTDYEAVVKSVESLMAKDVAKIAPLNEEEMNNAKMENIKKIDIATSELNLLIEIEDMVKESIQDIISFCIDCENKYDNEFYAENPIYRDLYLKCAEIKLKYEDLL
jgi:hypothetical protein